MVEEKEDLAPEPGKFQSVRKGGLCYETVSD